MSTSSVKLAALLELKTFLANSRKKSLETLVKCLFVGNEEHILVKRFIRSRPGLNIENKTSKTQKSYQWTSGVLLYCVSSVFWPRQPSNSHWTLIVWISPFFTWSRWIHTLLWNPESEFTGRCAHGVGLSEFVRQKTTTKYVGSTWNFLPNRVFYKESCCHDGSLILSTVPLFLLRKFVEQNERPTAASTCSGLFFTPQKARTISLPQMTINLAFSFQKEDKYMCTEEPQLTFASPKLTF